MGGRGTWRAQGWSAAKALRANQATRLRSSGVAKPISCGRHEKQPIFTVDRKARMVFTVPTWPAPHRPPASAVTAREVAGGGLATTGGSARDNQTSGASRSEATQTLHPLNYARTVLRRPGVARTDWRGACDKPCTCPKGRKHITPVMRMRFGRALALE